MATGPFYWDDLLDFIVERRNVVIPVIGRDLLTTMSDAGPVSFETLLARRLSQILRHADQSDDLTAVIDAELDRNPLKKIELTRALKQAHDELVATVVVPEPLRLLVEISDFPLLITATTDALLARVIRESRATEPHVLSAAMSGSDDLPAGWELSEQPIVYHLFGRMAATPGFALTEEDRLEFLWSHSIPERRPPRLFDALRQSHILLLGNSFPDWFMRFFLRLMKGRRLRDELDTIEALADESARGRREAALITFLERYSLQTRIYEEGGAAEFVAQLHAKWKARRRPHQRAGGQYEPDDMGEGSVFISYTRHDYEAAERLWQALDAAGIDAWFDRSRLAGGDPFEEKIRRHIGQCDLFLPLISKNTESREEGFVFKEWHWAKNRAEGMTRTFIYPMNLDDLDPDRCDNIPQIFREANFRALARTGPTPELVNEIRGTIRRIRSRRAA